MAQIKLFESNQIRSIWNETDQKWYFVVADVVQVLTNTSNPSDYIKKMRKRDQELAKGWGQFVPTLPVPTAGGIQKMGCADTLCPKLSGTGRKWKDKQYNLDIGNPTIYY